jgi:hypothetical protein
VPVSQNGMSTSRRNDDVTMRSIATNRQVCVAAATPRSTPTRRLGTMASPATRISWATWESPPLNQDDEAATAAMASIPAMVSKARPRPAAFRARCGDRATTQVTASGTPKVARVTTRASGAVAAATAPRPSTPRACARIGPENKATNGGKAFPRSAIDILRDTAPTRGVAGPDGSTDGWFGGDALVRDVRPVRPVTTLHLPWPWPTSSLSFRMVAEPALRQHTVLGRPCGGYRPPSGDIGPINLARPLLASRSRSMVSNEVARRRREIPLADRPGAVVGMAVQANSTSAERAEPTSVARGRSRRSQRPNARAAEAERTRLVGGAVAAVVLVLLAMRTEIQSGLTIGYLAAAFLSPLWVPTLRRYWGARLLLVVGLFAVASGLWLTESFAATRDTSLGQMVALSVGMLGILCGIGFVLWCRTVLSDAQVALWFGVGLLLGVTPTSELYLTNPWKFGYSFALTLIVLALARQTGRRWLEFLAVSGFTVIAAFTDARSAFAILLLTAVIVLWQMRPGHRTRTVSTAWLVLVIGVLTLVVYMVAQALILDGTLGEETQLRSDAQLQTSGSLILGGRPEAAATAALMLHQPFGFGTGTQPSGEDILAAKSGLSRIGYDPNNNYVDIYMFGGHIELHSIVGDLWAWFGIPGLLLTGVLVAVVLRGIAGGIARGTASAVALYVVIKLFWALPFGPVYSSATIMILAVGLALMPTTPMRAAWSGELRRGGRTSP